MAAVSRRILDRMTSPSPHAAALVVVIHIYFAIQAAHQHHTIVQNKYKSKRTPQKYIHKAQFKNTTKT